MANNKHAWAQGDPFKTLFVGRISYDATEKKLRREFEEYGPIKSIRLVNEKRSGMFLRACESHGTVCLFGKGNYPASM